MSNNAPALDGIGLQRAAALPSESPWLSWLGPWNRTSSWPHRGRIARPGQQLADIRLAAYLAAAVALEIGLTRMVQFGGTGHPETLGSFERAVVGDHQNVQDYRDAALDSGNGLAGYDARLRCPDAIRCAFYAQAMGEDDRKHLPYKFLGLFGTEVWSADGVTRMFFEAAEVSCREHLSGDATPNCAYRNHAYPGAFTASNRWLGSSAGPDARLFTLGWIDSDWGSVVRLDIGRIGTRIGTFGGADGQNDEAGRLFAFSARRSWHIGAASVTPEFDWNRVSNATGKHVDARAGLELSMPLDGFGTLSPGQFAERLSAASQSSTTQRLLVATALIGGAAVFDRAAESYARAHRSEPALSVLRRGGSALPYAEFGLAGVAWLARQGSSDGDVALASVEAGLTSVAMTEVIKLAVDRSRPDDGRGAADFGHAKRSDSSFPSFHTALAWSVLTPVAQRYDAPWLYGVAALTNFGRVAGRQHWLSDTVAGSVLGYVVGDWFRQRADASRDGTSTTVMLVPRGAVLSTSFR